MVALKPDALPYSQMEVLVPHRIQIAIDSLSSLFGLPDLDGDIGVTGACFVLRLETLGTQNCGE